MLSRARRRNRQGDAVQRLERAVAAARRVRAAAIAAGADVAFPENGILSSTNFTRAGDDSFVLAEPGVYQVQFVVSAAEAGQLVLTLNGAELPYTVVGRDAAGSQIVGTALVQTTAADSVLTVRNPAGAADALTLTPTAGGAEPVSAQLIITQLQ